jgi:hypothetical protein
MKLAFVGDIYLSGRNGGLKGPEAQHGIFAALQAKIGPDTRLIGNVESALSDREDANPHKWASLRSDPAVAQRLKALAVGCIANNHAGDAGWQGLRDTMLHLQQAGIEPVGCGLNIDEALAPCVLSRDGTRVALVALCCLTTNGECVATYAQPGVAPVSVDNLRMAVARGRLEAETVIVLVHWGCEQTHYPVPDQIRLGRIAIDAGAAAVIGCHAHVIQTFEEYRGGWIFHGLGNFFFDPVRARAVSGRKTVAEFDVDHSDRRNRESLVPVFEVQGNRLELLDLILTRRESDDRMAVGELKDAAVDVKAANAYLRRWARLHGSKLQSEAEIRFRCVLRNGTVKYDYDGSPIRREWRPRGIGARICRRANRLLADALGG